MAITKSNKHELSLDLDKAKERNGRTLISLLALMRHLTLDLEITKALTRLLHFIAHLRVFLS
jgi:hypothetical protein